MALGTTSLGQFALGNLGIVMVHRLPRSARFVQIFGLHTRRHVLGNILQLDMDSVALAVSVRSPFLSGQHQCVGVAIALAHW